MGRVVIHPSAALASLIRERREEMGLSLREVERETAALGEPIPFTTLSRIEQGRVDPGVKRLHALLRVYHLPVELASDLLDLEQFTGSFDDEGQSFEELYESGKQHMKAGRLREGMSALFALRRKTAAGPEGRHQRQRALLGLAIAAGNLGKWRLSREIVDRLLVEPPEPALMVNVLLQGANCWLWLGSTDMALALVDRAEAHVESDDHRKRAWVLGQRATVRLQRNELDEADDAAALALQSYARSDDRFNEGKALAVQVRLARTRGDHDKSLILARRAVEHARRHGFKILEAARGVDEGRSLAALGQIPEAFVVLEQAYRDAVTCGDFALRFYAHHALWKAHAAGGDRLRAGFERLAARYYVSFVDEMTAEAIEVRAMPEDEAPRSQKRRARG